MYVAQICSYNRDKQVAIKQFMFKLRPQDILKTRVTLSW